MKISTFKPTRAEVRSIRNLAEWCEEATGQDRTINGEPSSVFWSRCAFALSAEVAARSVSA